MNRDFTPLLTTTDWNAEWMRLQEHRRPPDNAEHWNERAKTFPNPLEPSSYAKSFLELADIGKGDTVFDMGCGNGALSIPLAADGHEVIAADFSSGMLDALKQDSEKCGCASNIKRVLASWDDDWESLGIEPKSADVAIASRSIATRDLQAALLKLASVARKRCCITLSCGVSPRADSNILQAIGLQNSIGKDFVYAFMILAQEGVHPSLQYISSTRRDTYASAEDAYLSLKKMVEDACLGVVGADELGKALDRLRDWIGTHLEKNPSAGKANEFDEVEGDYVLDEPRRIKWAFISWDA